ncbi:MAG: hypothetical protein ACI9UU_000398 [Candidatus Azotimanducaceae bacterium]|jgi:hypothetical protein
MTILFDPHQSWAALRDKALVTENSLHRQLITEVGDHMEAEIQAQHDDLMATLTEHPIYHFWRVGPENMVLDGRDAVATFYEQMFASNGQQFHVVLNKIMVDDSGVITEGQVRQVYQSKNLQAMGLSEVNGQALTSSDLWLSNAQLITVWPHDGHGKLVGEDIYFGEDSMTTLVPFDATNLPSYYIL